MHLAALLTSMMQLCVTSTCEQVRALAAETAARILSSTGLFEHCRLEANAFIVAFIHMSNIGQPLSEDATCALRTLIQAIEQCHAAPYRAADAVMGILQAVSSQLSTVDMDAPTDQASLCAASIARHVASYQGQLPFSPLLLALKDQLVSAQSTPDANCRSVALYLHHVLQQLAGCFVPALLLTEAMKTSSGDLLDTVVPELAQTLTKLSQAAQWTLNKSSSHLHTDTA
jgi:hypothetical protein